MDQQTLVSGLVTIAVGAVSGGVTNAVAIWMLFHPYERRGLGPFALQGAIPKNKARLAKSIGKTVGERLLTPADLADRLAAPGVREAFARALDGVVGDLLERERGPLRDLLGPAIAQRLPGVVDVLAERLADRLAAYAATPEFTRQVADLLARLREDLGDRPLGELLTPDRRARLHDAIGGWVERRVQAPETEADLHRLADTWVASLAADQRPLLALLPAGVVDALQHAIADYLPVALDRLGAVLTDPGARSQIRQALRDAFDRSVRDMLLHERLVARLMVTDRTFDRLLDGFEREGFDRFAAALTTPDMRDRVAGAVRGGVMAALEVPLAERLDRLGPERREALARSLGDWLVRLLRSRGAREIVTRVLDHGFDQADRWTWNAALDLVPSERLAGSVAGLLQADGGRRWVRDGTRAAADGLLGTPLGRPADWFRAADIDAVRGHTADAAWGWVQSQVPVVVAQLSVPEMVEQKVLGFSTARMEEIIRSVTQRELTLIVRLGYVLGALVGAVAFLLDLVMGR